MGTATVETLSREAASRQREELLHDLNMTLDELRDRADSYLLTADQTVTWRRIEDLTWLLGE